MKYLSYLLAITLYLHSVIYGMESIPPLKKNTCTFITNETEPCHLTVPLPLAQQCKTINTQINELQCTAITYPTKSSKEDTLEFISYLKKIAVIDRLATNQSPSLKMHNDILTQHIQTFNDPELIELTRLVDYFEVINEKFENNALNKALIEEVSKRIAKTINNREDATPFHIFNNQPICRDIMQCLTKKDKIDSKLVQLYSDLLTQQSSLPRTEPRLESILTKIYNCCWSWNIYNWSWDTIRYKPRYMNTTTGTIIKTEEIVDEACNTTKTKSLKIFKKNSPPICIPLTDVDKITHINANADESLFICNLATMRIINKRPTYNNSGLCLLINPNDTEKPIKEFEACAFTQKNNEVCIKIDKLFGILNCDTKKVLTITFPDNSKLIKKIIHITPINKKETFALATKNKIIIGKHKNNNFTFRQLAIKNAIKTINLISLCPSNNILYIAAHNSDNEPIFFILNSSQESQHYSFPNNTFPDHVEFLSDDILFLGYDKKNDHFFNLKTENSWIKQKSPFSIGRLALTTDFMSIEEIASDSDSENKYHNRRITTKMTLLIDPIIIGSIERLNSGYIPLTLYTVAKTEFQLCNLPDNEIEQLNHQNEALKTLIAKTKTITSSDSPKTINAFHYLYHGAKQVCSTMIGYIKPVVTCILYIIGFIILSMMDKKTKLNEDTFKTLCNFHSFIDQIFWLVE